MNPIAARVAMAEEAQLGLEEVKRICSLPVERQLLPAEVEEVSRGELTREAWDSGFRLWRQQAEAILAFQAQGGLFAPLRVGGGKSNIVWLCAKDAFQRQKMERILVLVPPRLFTKAVLRDVPLARKTIGLTAPVHGMGGLPPARRLALARSGWRGVFVYPYSLLRTETTDDELAAIKPDLVIADECHALKNVRGSCGSAKRFMKLMKDTNARFVALSGTVAKRSLADYWHLILLALRERCPLPRVAQIVDLWSSALDVHGQIWKQDEAEETAPGLEPLRVWALEAVKKGLVAPEDVGGPLTSDPPGYRRAFRVRRNTCPGVVASAEGELGVSLIIENVPAVEEKDAVEKQKAFEADLEGRLTGEEDFIPAETFKDMEPLTKMKALMWAVEKRWTTPYGDQIEYGIHKHKWLQEISAGFYNELVWPTVEDVMREWHLDQKTAEEELRKSKAHHRALQQYKKEERRFLVEDHVPGLDLPMLVGAACARGGKGVPGKVYEAWLVAKNLDYEGRIERRSRVAHVCDYKILAALDWAKKLEGKGGLVWVWNIEMGIWASQILSEGLGADRVAHCPAGAKWNKFIQEPEAATKICVCSLTAHGEGKDLQHFSEQFFLQFPRSADMAEQALGRTHRPGQLADELVVRLCLTTGFDHQSFNACLADALWLHSTEGRQKIIYADYTTPPRLHPSDFLEQRGFELLSKDQDAALRAVLGQTQV